MAKGTKSKIHFVRKGNGSTSRKIDLEIAETIRLVDKLEEEMENTDHKIRLLL